MKDAADSIRAHLAAERPLDALREYDQHGAADAEPLRQRFGSTMSLLRLAYDLNLAELSLRHGEARKEERRRVRNATVQRILELSHDRPRLDSVAKQFPRLVLEGTLQQQFCSKLATAFKPDLEVPDSVCATIIVRLIEALDIVLRVGAPTNRDSAIEGLGALLQRVDVEAVLPKVLLLPVERNRGEKRDEDYIQRARISKEYFDRLERRRMMALTIAGEPDARTTYAESVRQPLIDVLQRIRNEQRRIAKARKPLRNPVEEARRRELHVWLTTRKIEAAVYERADLLRILPAVARQHGRRPLFEKPTRLLVDAARPLPIEEDDSDDVRIAFARYHETLFRTLDIAMERGWNWKKFDAIIAAAVRSIPQTIAGSPAVCNAQVRATVAVLRTAAGVVKASNGASAATPPLAELFDRLGRKVTKWANPGIAEGCYLAIPQLVSDPLFDKMLRPALLALFEQMKHVPGPDDLVNTHRRLAANSSFRRVLVSLTDRLQEGQLIESEADALLDRQNVERNLRTLLHSPTPDNIRNVCQRKLVSDPESTDVDEIVVAGIAFEADLLRRAPELFREWKEKPTADKVLLTRILATQLHAISRDAPELARHPVLRNVFLATPSISMSDVEAMAHAWQLLALLPPDAAQIADVEIQRFVDYRGGATGEPDKRNRANDLPGYVLAMIDPAVSRRIASGIAREIDLRRRHEEGRAGADIAKTLYQVTLRGPHESVFDHLLPRINDPKARRVVRLFRRHVANIRRSRSDDGKLNHSEIRMHVEAMLKDLRPHEESNVLRTLRAALVRFRDLMATGEVPGQTVWDSLARGDGLDFLEGLDELAEVTDHEKERPRRRLMSLYERRMSDLQQQAEHYVDLDVGKFDARIEALQKAADAAQSMETEFRRQDALQPPEQFLLVALMEHLRDVFDRTRRWFCEDPQQKVEEKDIAGFWLLYCDPRPLSVRADELQQQIDKRDGDLWERADAIKRHDTLRKRQNVDPARYAHQALKFRDFFVDWRQSELDVSTLKARLKCDWPRWFQGLYWMVTNFLGISTVILLPCAWAAIAHLLGHHKIEGAVFFLEAFLMIVIAVVSLFGAVHFVRREKKRKAERDQQTGEVAASDYRYESLLPRLARLIAVPMTLTVEFDHSYKFPMEGSTWALLLLMMLSYLTTRFFVTREIVDVRERPGRVETTQEEKKRAAQIVALALAHSFGIAVLLSAIFASSFEYPKHTKVHKPAPGHSWFETVFLEIDKPSPPEHPYPAFLGVLQREVELDLRAVCSWTERLGNHAVFKFYPTVILTWTALGLFFGAFLEGFMSGKRLRGGEAKEREAGH